LEYPKIIVLKKKKKKKENVLIMTKILILLLFKEKPSFIIPGDFKLFQMMSNLKME